MTTQELKQQIDKVLGNSIRCLLPSYWWKRLFNQVADRIDEVEQSTSQLIDSKVEEVKMPIVESVDELEKLNVEKGGLAAVKKVGEPVIVNYEDFYISLDYVNDWDKYTIIKRVGEIGEVPSDAAGGFIPFAADKYNFYADTLVVGIEDGKRVYGKYLRSGVSIFTLDEVNEYLASGRYRLVGGYLSDRIAQYFTFYSAFPQPSLYIKGASWERLVKESDLEGIEGGSGEDNVVTFYAPIDNVSLSDTEKQHNAESYQKVADGFESDTYYDIKVLLSTSQLVALDVIKTINPASDNGRLKLIFGGVGSGIDLQMLTVTSDGSATTEKVEGGEGGSSITIDSELSDTSTNAVQNKVVTAALNNKADKTDIKTINGVSLLGGGNLQLGEGVSEDYVNTAIANAITTTLNTAV